MLPHKISFFFNPWAINVITDGGVEHHKKWPYAVVPHIRQHGLKTWAVGMWWFLYLRFYKA